MCKGEKLAEERFDKTFKLADACAVMYDKGLSLEDIAKTVGINVKDVEQSVRLSKAFPEGKRWKNIPLDIYVWAAKYPDPEKAIGVAWQKKWYGNDLKRDFKKFQGVIPVPVSERERQTPIEIALGVNEEGMTTAKKLYAFLELHPAHYSKWVRKNIEKNMFAEAEMDYFLLTLEGECPNSGARGRFARDYKLTATFAKKLAMASQTPKGEEAREYFIRVEQNAKNFASGKMHCMTPAGGAFTPSETAEFVLEVANQFKDYLPKECLKRLTYTAVELKGVRQIC